MIKKTKLAKAIAYATVGAAITAGSMTNAYASTTIYNVNSPYASNIVIGGTGTDGWTSASGGENPDIGWTSASAPFGTTASVVNWAAEITAAGDSLTISSQDAHTRYGIWADIDTAKGGWFDGTQGWGHNTDVGLFKSDVATNVTINITALQPPGSNETWSNFGVSVYTGMTTASNGWSHHGTWNCPTCTVTLPDGTQIQTNPTFTDDDPLNSGTSLSYLTHDATVDDLNSISFHANAGQVYSILLGGNDGGSNFSPLAGYSLDITTSPVPIPGAVWLFSGALAGLAGIKRRKLTA